MPQLLAIAEYITKTLAICMVCGDPANHTQRLVASSDRVLVGATGHLRGALPPLLRPAPGAVAREPRRSPKPAMIAVRSPTVAHRLAAAASASGSWSSTSSSAYAVLRSSCGAAAHGAADVAGAAGRRYYGCSRSGSASCSASSSSTSWLFSGCSRQAFGELMMFVYYVYVVPLSLTHRARVLRGRHLDRPAFIPYASIGGAHAGGRASTRCRWSLHLAAAQPRAPPDRARPQLRRGAPAAARQDRARTTSTSREAGLDLGSHDERDDV